MMANSAADDDFAVVADAEAELAAARTAAASGTAAGASKQDLREHRGATPPHGTSKLYAAKSAMSICEPAPAAAPPAPAAASVGMPSLMRQLTLNTQRETEQLFSSAHLTTAEQGAIVKLLRDVQLLNLRGYMTAEQKATMRGRVLAASFDRAALAALTADITGICTAMGVEALSVAAMAPPPAPSAPAGPVAPPPVPAAFALVPMPAGDLWRAAARDGRWDCVRVGAHTARADQQRELLKWARDEPFDTAWLYVTAGVPVCFSNRDGSRLKLWLGTHGQEPQQQQQQQQQQPAAAAVAPAAPPAIAPGSAQAAKAAVAMPASASAAKVGSGAMVGGAAATAGLAALGIGSGIASFEPLCLAASTAMFALYRLCIANHFNSQMLGVLTEYVVLHKDIVQRKLAGLAHSDTRERILRGLQRQCEVACQLIEQAGKTGAWASVNKFFNAKVRALLRCGNARRIPLRPTPHAR